MLFQEFSLLESLLMHYVTMPHQVQRSVEGMGLT